MELSEEERELIIQSLRMRVNYMETRDPVLSARDAINMKKHRILRLLNQEQCIFRVKMEDLIKKIDKST